MTSPSPESDRLTDVRRRRRAQFLNHLVIYFAVMVVAVPANYLVAPAQPWFLVPLVGWGVPLAVHAAYVMELFGEPRI